VITGGGVGSGTNTPVVSIAAKTTDNMGLDSWCDYWGFCDRSGGSLRDARSVSIVKLDRKGRQTHLSNRQGLALIRPIRDR
jgi:hypothetical protein